MYGMIMHWISKLQPIASMDPFADRNSRIYSPDCSAAVTTGGRWCLALAESILKKYGYGVVFGDTDSCFVAPTNKVKCKLVHVMTILSTIFLYTPFPGLSMEIEKSILRLHFWARRDTLE